MTALGFEHHDHSDCVADVLHHAETVCQEAGLQFTQTRRRVLEILLREHRAIGAYEILEILRSEGQSAQPPVAYRALDFLLKHGFAHKIERLNAYIACTHIHSDHAPVFLICQSCDAVAEICSEKSTANVDDLAQSTGFEIDRTIIEATGLCPNCQDANA